MDITVVGSGTVVPSPDRVCSSYYVESGDLRVLMDCGPGALHHMARFGVPWPRLSHVVLTHFHNDHIGDLPILFFALKYGLAEPRREPLIVLGPVGTADLFRRLAEAFGPHLTDPGFDVNVRELRDGDGIELDTATTLRTHVTPHTDASLAYRVETDRGTLGYTGDTGPSEALGHFMHGVDVLIAECSLPDDIAIASHLSPSSVVALALLAQPRELVLTHIYPQLDRATLSDGMRARGWGGGLRLADDGMHLTIPTAGTRC